MEQESFSVLENEAIGRSIALHRKLRGIKAFDIASQLEIKEQTYLKYERGETQITIAFIQKVANVLKVDPLQMMAVSPGHFIESIQNNYSSPGIGIGNKVEITGDFNAANEKQTQLMLQLLQSQIALNERIIELLEKK